MSEREGSLFDKWKVKLSGLREQVIASPLFNKMKKNASFLPEFTNHATVNIVGLDIEPNAAKLLKINCSQSPCHVENYASVPLPSGAVTVDHIKDAAALNTALRDLFRQSGVSSKNIAFAIPRSLAIIKTITIDSRLSGPEIESRVWIEANRHFPELVGEIYLDFSIIGPSMQDPSQLELILVACRKEQIDPYLEAFKQVGLNAKIIDIDCYALERALPLVVEPSKFDTLGLLNLSTHLSTLVVVQKGRLIYAHNHAHDGSRLIEQTTKYRQEKQLINDGALLEDAGYKELLRENLIAHLHHIVHLFYTSRPDSSLQKILLSGDCATVPCLSTFLSQEIGIETAVVNPFEKMTFASHINQAKITAEAPSLMLCCGLALSKLGA